MEKLIQEDYLQEHWKMMVSCILLNQTSNLQVRKVLAPLFAKIKDPLYCSYLNPEDFSGIIKSTGFSNIKAKRIVEMSKKWVCGFDDVMQLPGIGQYGKDSWDIFVNKNLQINPSDKKLVMYLNHVRGK